MEKGNEKRLLLLLISVVFLLVSCSTKKNTKTSRFYHSFTTRYNVYFNGKTAFDEALQVLNDEYSGNYSEMIHMYPVSALPRERESAEGPFDAVIEKSEKAIKQHSIRTKPSKKPGWRTDSKQVAFREKEEYNPFLKHCWLLLGKAQFYNTDFLQAATTFSYISRHYADEEAVSSEARIWQAWCYAEMGWLHESAGLLKKLDSHGISPKNNDLFAAVSADCLIKNGRFEEAIPYLQAAIKAEKNRKQRTRMKYLLGQIYAEQGLNGMAYAMFGQVIKAHPPYELEFAARIRQTEVFSGNYQRAVKKLKRMAEDEKNKDFQLPVYYGLGNIYLSRKDTLNALASYRFGIEKSREKGIDKAICLIKSGDIYFSKREYINAYDCFNGALTNLSKEYKEYKRVAGLSKTLDELVFHLKTIHLQDSLQTLKHIPKEEIVASNALIIYSLYHTALIYKDKLEDFPLAIQCFETLNHRFPGNPYCLESYYQLFLTGLRTADTRLADEYKEKLLRSFPESDYAVSLSQPDYEYYIRTIDKVQDSIYQKAYRHYIAGEVQEVRQYRQFMAEYYPLAGLMPKFMFLDALTYIETGDTGKLKDSLKTLLDKYPNADVSELAGEILKGILQGRTPQQGSVRSMAWNVRLGTEANGKSGKEDMQEFSTQIDTPFQLSLLYPGNSLDKNQLLFTVAAYNFANFSIKEFDLIQEKNGPVNLLNIRGFNTFEEVLFYYNMIYGEKGYASALHKEVIVLPVSLANYEILVNGKTIEEYIDFFDENWGELIPEILVRRSVHYDADMLEKEINEEEPTDTVPPPIFVPEKTIVTSQQKIETEIATLFKQEQDSKRRQAETNRKTREKGQQKLQRKKEQEYKERLKLREKTRKEKEKEYRKKLREREKAQREIRKAKEAATRKR